MSSHSRALALSLFLAACGADHHFEPAGDAPLPRSNTRVRGRKNFIGVFDPQSAHWRLKLQRPGWNEEDVLDREFVYGAPGDTPLIGDWDGDGDDSQGTFRDGTWTLSSELGSDAQFASFQFGQPGDTPIVGDWDGDGLTTVGTYRDGTFSLRNSNDEGLAQVTVQLGGAGDIPIVGDWDGDGRESVGVFVPAEGKFRLIDEHVVDANVVEFVMPAPVGAQPVIGDWDDDGVASIGLRHESRWTLRNVNRMELGTTQVDYGGSADVPIVGSWRCEDRLGFTAAPPELANFFILAADHQPSTSFDKWLGRGINTVVRVPSEEALEPWNARAVDLGLKMIRAPRPDPRDDEQEANLLAYILRDEPEVRRGCDRVDPFEEIEQVALRVRSERLRVPPIFTNFAGWLALNPDANDCNDRDGRGDARDPDFYSRYVELQDWVSQDIYPLGQMMARGFIRDESDAMATLPMTMDKLRRWAPTKPQFAYIESSQSNSHAEPPLEAGQFRAQVWAAIVHGARGIFYFPHGNCDLDCSLRDVTPPDVADEMLLQNGRIEEIASALQSEINGPALSVSGAQPLHVGWRVHGGDKYVIAVNYSTQSVERWISLAGALPAGDIEVMWEGRRIQPELPHAFTDTFGPYEVHVYRFR